MDVEYENEDQQEEDEEADLWDSLEDGKDRGGVR